MTNWKDLGLPIIYFGDVKELDDIKLVPLSIRSSYDGIPIVKAQETGSIEILESESVNKLKIQFKKGKNKVFIPYLQVVGGGKQDRMVTRPYIMESNSEEVIEFPVNCVEQGRWQYSRASTGEQTSNKFEAMKNIRMSASLGAVNMNANQGSTWSSIGLYQKMQGISQDVSPSQSFMEMEQAVLDEKPRNNAEEEKKTISDELKQFVKHSINLFENQTGVVLFINNTLRVVELYGTPTLWKEQSEGVVNSILSEIKIFDKESEDESTVPKDIDSLRNLIYDSDFKLNENKSFGNYYTSKKEGSSSLLLLDNKELVEFYLACSNKAINEESLNDSANFVQEQQLYQNVILPESAVWDEENTDDDDLKQE